MMESDNKGRPRGCLDLPRRLLGEESLEYVEIALALLPVLASISLNETIQHIYPSIVKEVTEFQDMLLIMIQSSGN